MKIKELKFVAKSFLSKEEDLLVIDVLLHHLLNLSELDLIKNPDLDLSVDVVQAFFELLDRYVSGEPLAYIVNRKEFYGHDFFVDNHVLIPRPESEFLLDEILIYLRENPTEKELKILDVGTGSGCLLLSLLLNLPNATGIGVDISSEALEVAKINAERLNLINRVKLVKGDLAEDIDQKFDIIIANLPYIGTEIFNEVDENVKNFEPNLALYAGKDGLDLYRKLFDQIKQKDLCVKLLLGEYGKGQTDLLKAEIEKNFSDRELKIIQDYALIDRVFMVDFSKTI